MKHFVSLNGTPCFSPGNDREKFFIYAYYGRLYAKTGGLCIYIHAFMHRFFLLGKYSRYIYGTNTTNRTFSC